ncbi:uncharacterized protein LOC111886187 [Lactuca sativa]|uniref:uncharacterized protein LOC111886187 n=1 Tax=Lactuca sativa TaxID=4236 RepID=UPI000CD98F7A|nr:uncharacterized protein LOC111886187 [Lactuca sativa]
MRELQGAFPPVVYNYLRGCKTAKEIWNTLKEKFQGSEKTKINSVKQCLVELKEFKQKDGESIEGYYDRLNELIYKCNHYGITRSTMEFNLAFIMGLRKEWRSVSMMVEIQQSFDNSTLNDLYNLLKTHEGEVNEIVEETKLVLGGPLALVSKVIEKETLEKENSNEEGFLMNPDDEAVAFYSNNRVKKFFKKPFNPKSKPNDGKGSFVKKVVSDDKKKVEKNDVKVDDAKVEKKLKGDSGIDCYYYHNANHMANDCMLRKKDEKKNKVKNESYYDERLEEVRAKAKGMSLVAIGEGEDDGTYQIWSFGSDDEQMCNPTHGTMYARFVEKDEEVVTGRSFVTKSGDKSLMTTKLNLTEFLIIDFSYGIVKIDEYLDANELVEIVNDTLNKSEQIKNFKRTENSKSNSQSNFVDIEDNFDSFSEISEIEEEKVSIVLNCLDSQTDSSDDEHEDEVSKNSMSEKNVSKETIIP